MNIYDELKHSGRETIIFGAGPVGEYILERCRANGLEIKAFCDNSFAKQGTELDGVPIKSFDAFKAEPDRFTFIVTVGYFIEVLIAQLESGGCRNYAHAYRFYSVDEIKALEPTLRRKLMAAYYFGKWFDAGDVTYLKSLDLVITERCSLKCRECSNLMQYYQSPKDFSIEQVKREIDRVLEIYDYVYELRLIGGEPFVNGKFAEIISYLNEQSKIMSICIYTNGTIIPRDSAFEIMKSGDKTWLSISDYGSLSRKLRELTEACERFGIECDVKPIEFWTRCSTFIKHNRTVEEQTRTYNECCAKDITTLIKGRLYPCPYIANGLNLHALPDEPGNYVDIMSDAPEDELRRQTESMLKHRKYFSLCDYCNGRPYLNVPEEEKIPPHEQTKSPLPYHRFD